MTEDLITVQSVMLLESSGGGAMNKFRGNERKALKAAAKALDQLHKFDLARPSKSKKSKLSDTYVFPSGDSALIGHVNGVMARLAVLLDLT